MIALEGKEHFDFGSAEYQALLARSDATAFQSPEWLTPFYRHLGSTEGAEPLIIVGRSPTGELEMVLPLLRRSLGGLIRVEYAFLGVTDYACPVLAAEFASHVTEADRLPDRLSRTIGPCDVVLIKPVRQEHLALWRVLIKTPPRPMDYSAHAVSLGSPFRAWRRQNLGARRAGSLDRKARRLADSGSLCLSVVTGNRIGEALAKARDFRKGRFADDAIQNDAVLAFYADVALRGHSTRLARTYELRDAEGTIAVIFGLVDGNRFCYLVLGCDYARCAKHSPGLVALDLVMADWANNGGAVFDFTVGDEPFKAIFGCEQTPMFSLEGACTKAGAQFLASARGG